MACADCGYESGNNVLCKGCHSKMNGGVKFTMNDGAYGNAPQTPAMKAQKSIAPPAKPKAPSGKAGKFAAFLAAKNRKS